MSERIASFAVHPVALPFKRPYVTATGRIERRKMAVLELRGDSGARGWGDAVPMSLRGGPGLASVAAELDRTALALVAREIRDGSATDAAASVASLLAPLKAGGVDSGALAAVEAALLDLAGKAAGVPCWRLLGAGTARPVECNGTLGADSPDDAAAAAKELADAGFGSIKVKVGEGEGDLVAVDLRRMRAVKDAVGPDVALRVDANRAYTVDQAVELLEHRELALELAEQPCRELEELRAVREATSVPVVADESVNGVVEAEAAIDAGACDAVMAKLAKVGGPSAAIAIAAVAPTYLSSALDSAIGITAAVHTAQVLGAPRGAQSRAFPTGLAHGLATSQLFSDNVADASTLIGPSISAPDQPGLGIEVEESSLKRLRIEV